LAAAVEPQKGGVTPVGRALQKHAARPGSAFTGATGNAQNNTARGRQYLEAVLDHPESVVTNQEHPVFGKVVKVRTPDGQGVWFKESGEFIGFLEPSGSQPKE
jgi:streptogramin lyase